ncbi:hypothetical protein TrCOL_g12288 [Triparma columacea]|uniref:OPA3-like protein n=1 Tax=Triparma columacea TaxID=722753 RepID=A0A9W7FWC8_9STRA|nr:hypothetical protein TrCOL_g12288 [Triparma columacea]
MATALPLAKLGGLLLKTLSKPLSRSLKSQAAEHETIRGVLVYVGNLSHKVTARMSIWAGGFKVKKIGNLEHDKALQRGSDIFGETIILTVGSGVAVYEYNLSAEKNRLKEAAKMAKLRETDIELKTELRVLRSRIDALEGSRWVRPSSVDVHAVKQAVRAEVEGGDREGEDDGDVVRKQAVVKKRITQRNDIIKVWKDAINGRLGKGGGKVEGRKVKDEEEEDDQGITLTPERDNS